MRPMLHCRRHGCWWCGSYVFVVLQEMINIIGTTVQWGGLHPLSKLLTRSRGGSGHGTLRRTRTGEQAGKALRSQGHHYARVM